MFLLSVPTELLINFKLSFVFTFCCNSLSHCHANKLWMTSSMITSSQNLPKIPTSISMEIYLFKECKLNFQRISVWCCNFLQFYTGCIYNIKFFFFFFLSLWGEICSYIRSFDFCSINFCSLIWDVLKKNNVIFKV